jgi:predicted DNA binding CopG/RHH family protein
MTKPIRYFTKEYLERCKKMTPDQILEFLENYRMLFSNIPEKSQSIRLKIEPSLLKAFKCRTELEGTSYQTQIKKLMREWLKGSG